MGLIFSSIWNYNFLLILCRESLKYKNLCDVKMRAMVQYRKI